MDSASKENNESNSQDDSNMSGPKGKKRVRGPSFKLGGVSVNAKTMMACEQELEPLDEIIPSKQDERLKWLLECKTKPAHFDVEWGVHEDSRLLIGMLDKNKNSLLPKQIIKIFYAIYISVLNFKLSMHNP